MGSPQPSTRPWMPFPAPTPPWPPCMSPGSPPAATCRPALVGEHGPELFVSGTGGTVVPARQLDFSPAGSFGGSGGAVESLLASIDRRLCSQNDILARIAQQPRLGALAAAQRVG